MNKGKGKKHPPQQGKERGTWVQRPIPYPQEVMKTTDDARFEKFLELIKNLCLQIPLVDAIKIPLYSKYMKYIVSNKRKIPNEAITAICLLIILLRENYQKSVETQVFLLFPILFGIHM